MAGLRDAPFITGIVGSVGAILSVAGLPFTHSADVATVLVAITLFFVSTPMAPSTAVMQIVPPAAMRSRVSAIFLFFNSFIGLTLGSAVVGLLNDHVQGRRPFGGQHCGRLGSGDCAALGRPAPMPACLHSRQFDAVDRGRAAPGQVIGKDQFDRRASATHNAPPAMEKLSPQAMRVCVPGSIWLRMCP
jgi:hypothetical protein